MEPPMGLSEDLASAQFQHGVTQRFWDLVRRDADTVYIRLHAPDDRSYVIRLLCSDYGNQPLDGCFVDPSTFQCVAQAWPQGNATFEQWIKFKDQPGNLFICWDQDRRGNSTHPGWLVNKAWQRNKNQLVGYVDFLRQLLWIPSMGYERK
jgi:hypothetical protein